MPVERRLLALIFGQRVGILRRDRMILARRRRGQPVAGRRGRIDELRDSGVRARIPARAPCPARWSTCIRSAARSTARCRRCRRSGTRSRLRETRAIRLQVADVGSSKARSGLPWWWARLPIPAADQIVDDADAVAAIEQEVDHVAADEAGAAGDDGDRRAPAHCAPIFFIVRTL